MELTLSLLSCPTSCVSFPSSSPEVEERISHTRKERKGRTHTVRLQMTPPLALFSDRCSVSNMNPFAHSLLSIHSLTHEHHPFFVLIRNSKLHPVLGDDDVWLLLHHQRNSFAQSFDRNDESFLSDNKCKDPHLLREIFALSTLCYFLSLPFPANDICIPCH